MTSGFAWTVASILSVTLAAIALLHAYWGCGGLWPARSEAELIATVIGDGRRRMPGRALTFCVALAIAGAALWSQLLVTRDRTPLPAWPFLAGGVALAFVFLARGAAGYLTFWRRAHAAEPFARLDRRLYSPLCLVIGAGFAYLVLGA